MLGGTRMTVLGESLTGLDCVLGDATPEDELDPILAAQGLDGRFRTQPSYGMGTEVARGTPKRGYMFKAEGKLKKQTGGRGMFGHVWIELGPSEPGAGYVFENDITGGVIPKEFIPSVANTIGTNMANYKIIKKNQFLYL